MAEELGGAGKFYIGRAVDAATGKSSDQPIIYDSDDLTTHAVVVGMTGSGKTGLCVGLLEEAALSGIPALMIDPKGDLTNLLLHFPDLLPEDFQPWVNADIARRSDLSIEEVAREEAEKWRNGLAGWGIQPERIAALKQSAQFSIYTPGSDSGLPVSILASLKVPNIPWEQNRELLREKISSTVTALLGLVGLQEVDPVRSREHILLANIFEHAWSEGRDLELSELILQTQNPPFDKLGVFDVNTFYPQRERFDLAMQLNNILAAPSFQSWIEGQPLDIPSLLYTPEGQPRHSIFYIAHLNDQERMFFVTLLFSAIESWMRTQTGSPVLRSLVYFDEIFGYLPPVANPSSKPVILRMLKQARAFGVGLILATQNPADVDYKGLSNTGSWFIGKLQTDQDKQRLLDGLEGAMVGGFDRNQADRLISSLGKRVFLLNNVHEKQPLLLNTRWVMNYLAGPLTRAQIPALNQLAEAKPAQAVQAAVTAQKADSSSPQPTIPSQAAKAQVSKSLAGTSTRPGLPAGVSEYFLTVNLSFSKAFKAADQPFPEQALDQGILYRPALLAHASVRYLNRRYNLDWVQESTVLVSEPDRRGNIRWDDFPTENLKPDHLDPQPTPQARFIMPDPPLSEAQVMKGIEKDYLDWIYRNSQVMVNAHEELKIYAGPDISEDKFNKLCTQAAEELRDGQIDKVEKDFKRRSQVLKDKLDREERELAGDQSDLEQRKIEEWGTHAENLLSMFSGRRRRVSTSLSKRRQTAAAKADVEESIDTIADLKKQIQGLEEEKARAIEVIETRFKEMLTETSQIPVTPYKKDISLEEFGVAWMPYYLAKIGDDVVELPGFQAR